MTILNNFASTILSTLNVLNCVNYIAYGELIYTITVVVSIEIDSCLVAIYFYSRHSGTATVRSRTETVSWEVPQWLNTVEATSLVFELVETES